MALARTLAVGLTGLDGQLVEVECDISAGLPGLSFTGRADPSVVESRDRIKAAFANSGREWPARRVTVALLPADMPKAGSRFDLAICLAILAADRRVPREAVEGAVWIAELGLDGRLRPVRGVLPAVLAARRHGARRVVVSAANAAEAALVEDVDVRAAATLSEVLDWLTGDGPAPPRVEAGSPPDDAALSPDLADVAGQDGAKRAVELAAAGGHHLLLVGPPGAGKTMLAERLPGLLPPLADEDALAVTGVHSIAGLLGTPATLVRRPPFQSPHHTASVAALVGGGSRIARPGAISLAHGGVLFLDEAPEFQAGALDALRQPLETGEVQLHRQGGAVTYPARFQLVMAANPCACTQSGGECSCSPPDRRRYERKLSGPLRDRIDLSVRVARVAHHELLHHGGEPERTEQCAARVVAARARAAERLRGTPWRLNSAVPGWALRSAALVPERRALAAAEAALDQGRLSPRGFDRVLRVAWTIADLGGLDRPGADDVVEALHYRSALSAAWAA